MQRRLKRALTATALIGATVLGTAGWATGSGQTAVTGPPPGSVSWRADQSLDRQLPDPATTSPARTAGFLDRLSTAQQRDLAHRHPLTVGNLDGAPVALRYEANRLAIRQAVRQQRARADDSALPREYRGEAREKADRYAALLSPARHILAFDPRGRGQVAEVHGDLTTAQRTAVVVPGSDIDLGTFDRTGKNRLGTPTGMAVALRDRMARQNPETRTAVIAWTGYTTPVGLGPDAATSRLADAGAPRLARFLHGLASAGTPAPTVFCHSYGSVVCGEAAHRLTKRDAAGLVVMASPGMHADSASGLRTAVPVWATRDPGDWIGRVPHVRLLGLGHGADPSDPAFGARVVSSRGADGHTGYFAPGTRSLANFASITLGSYGDVQCAARGCRHGL